MKENKIWTRTELEKFFEERVEELSYRNCLFYIIKLLKEKKEMVVSKAVDMEISKKHIPFLPIVPAVLVGYLNLLSWIENDNEFRVSLFPGDFIFETKEDCSVEPYFIFDIDIGKKTDNNTLEYNVLTNKKEKYLSLSVEEGIFVCMHTKIYKNFPVLCLGSTIKINSHYCYPFIIFQPNNKPFVNYWKCKDEKFIDYYVPTCALRI
jgi:hypothetical protein